MKLFKKNKTPTKLSIADSCNLYKEVIDLFGGLKKVSRKKQRALERILIKYNDWNDVFIIK